MIGVREGNEIQDSDILQKTQVETSPAGMMQLTYPADDGTVLLSSEWFEASKRSQTIIPWCGAVRQRLVQLFQETEAERRAKVEELRRSRPKVEIVEAERPEDDMPPAPPPTDPIAYARHQVGVASERASRLRGEKVRIEQELTVADRDLERWKMVLRTLGVIESEETAAAIIGSDQSGSVQQPGGAGTADPER